MFKHERHFTLDEARDLLPALRRAFKAIHRLRQHVEKHDAQVGRSLQATGGDVGGEPVAALLRNLVEINVHIARLNRLGLVIKDLDRGLVDFPHLREGREVFLCWELDEEDIEFWHDLDAGYAGRERL